MVWGTVRLDRSVESLRTLRLVESSVEALEGNKVKVTVQISEEEFDKDLDVAFKRLAKEVRLPGFRAGKAPRKVLEARIGSEYARGDAFENSLPRYYSEAVRDHEVDVIAPPDIDITDGETAGPVTFDAVVEVRPQVTIAGYDSLEVEVDAPEVDEQELDEAQERFLKAYGELVDADRPAENGDTIIMNIKAEVGGEAVPGLTADDYSYTLGAANIVPELDDELIAAEPGDELDFAANHPDPDEEELLRFSIKVTKVQRVELPEPTEEFMQQNSEFDNIEEYRADYVERMTASRVERSAADRRNAVAQAAGELVDGEAVTKPLIDLEVENRIEDMAMRMQQQGMQLEQFIQMTGQTNQEFVEGVRATAADGAKIDLALRAVAAAEGLECTDDELTDEVEAASEALDQPADEIRKRYAEAGMLPNIRADISKRKALDYLVEKATVKDSDGNVIAAERFELPDSEDTEPEADSTQAAAETEDSND